MSNRETSLRKKFQVEVTINYKDMGDQSSLFHQLTCFKVRISCQHANLKCFALRIFWSLITNLRPDFKNSKWLTQYGGPYIKKCFYFYKTQTTWTNIHINPKLFSHWDLIIRSHLTYNLVQNSQNQKWANFLITPWPEKLANFKIVRLFVILHYSQFHQFSYLPLNINQFQRFDFSIFILFEWLS